MSSHSTERLRQGACLPEGEQGLSLAEAPAVGQPDVTPADGVTRNAPESGGTRKPKLLPLDVDRSELLERFMSLISPEPNTGCWIFLGALDPSGYGVFSISRKRFRAHRVAYELLVAPIPDGLVLDHLCRSRWCSNPGHLEPVTSSENTKRGANTIKTHCIRGHELSGDNLYLRKGRGGRVCRTCLYAAQTRWYERNGGSKREYARAYYLKNRPTLPPDFLTDGIREQARAMGFEVSP